MLAAALRWHTRDRAAKTANSKQKPATAARNLHSAPAGPLGAAKNIIRVEAGQAGNSLRKAEKFCRRQRRADQARELRSALRISHGRSRTPTGLHTIRLESDRVEVCCSLGGTLGLLWGQTPLSLQEI